MKNKYLLFRGDDLIVPSLSEARSFKDRLVGLMFRRTMNTTEAIYFPNCRQVHTMFVRFPIDLIFINKDFSVVRIIHKMKPYRISPIVFNAYGVIEVTPGFIKKVKIKIGEKLKFEVGGHHA